MTRRINALATAAPVVLTDAAVVSFAIWTVLYDAALAVHARPSHTFVVWLAITASALIVCIRRCSTRSTTAPAAVATDSGQSGQENRPHGSRQQGLRLVAAFAAVFAALAVAFGTGPWSWWSAIVLGLIACASAFGTGRTSCHRVIHQTTARQAYVVLGAALGMAILSLLLARNSLDDVFYVGKSVWVAERNEVPLRDFLFTEQVLPASSAQPPVTSIEVFAGALARALGVHAASATWYLLLPAFAVIAVFCLWRLAQRWAPGRPLLVFAVALAYLLLVAGGDAALGTYHLPRLAQGKGIFVSALIPLAWVYATDLVESRSRRSFALLVALSIASVGLTSAAIMLLPILAGAAAVMIAYTGRLREAATYFSAIAGYPIAVGLVARLAHGGIAPAATATQFFDARQTLGRTLLVGVLGVIGGIALWGGPLLVRRGVPRLFTIGATTTLTLLLVPGVLEALNAATGLGPVLWRVPWIVPLPVLIGMIAVIRLPRLPLSGAAGRLSRSSWLPRFAQLGIAGVLVLAFAIAGTPAWSAGSYVTVTETPAWKVPKTRKAVAQWIRDLDRPPGLVLAPSTIMRTMPIVTSRVRVAMARGDYLVDYGIETQFAQDRIKLGYFADGSQAVPISEVADAIRRVGVTVICVWKGNTQASDAAPALGMVEFASRKSPGAMRCFRSTAPTRASNGTSPPDSP